MVLPVSRPKSTIRSSHFYFWSHCSNSSFTSCWCLRSWPRINGSSWLPTVLSAVWRGQRCLAELMNSEGLPAGKAFALEGNDALCIPHPTECWMRQIQALPNMEKRGERRTFPDSSLQIHDTTCRSTAPFYPQEGRKMWLSPPSERQDWHDSWFPWVKGIVQPLKDTLVYLLRWMVLVNHVCLQYIDLNCLGGELKMKGCFCIFHVYL